MEKGRRPRRQRQVGLPPVPLQHREPARGGAPVPSRRIQRAPLRSRQGGGRRGVPGAGAGGEALRPTGGGGGVGRLGGGGAAAAGGGQRRGAKWGRRRIRHSGLPQAGKDKEQGTDGRLLQDVQIQSNICD